MYLKTGVTQLIILVFLTTTRIELLLIESVAAVLITEWSTRTLFCFFLIVNDSDAINEGAYYDDDE